MSMILILNQLTLKLEFQRIILSMHAEFSISKILKLGLLLVYYTVIKNYKIFTCIFILHYKMSEYYNYYRSVSH